MRLNSITGLSLTPLLLAFGALAEPMPAAAKSEVMATLARLEASGCLFNRNGTWHNGADARAHLQRKLDYIEKNASVKTAEAYIAMAASKSSTSGEPYQVKCGSQAPVASSVWLLQQLGKLRSSGPERPPG
jgi:hypothetical protein